MDDEGIRTLAAAVVKQAATDVYTQRGSGQRSGEHDVRNGGLDLYFAILDIDMAPEYFIKRARRGKK